MLAASDDQIIFSTKPQHKEAFVGEDVQFDWDYGFKEVEEVRFGVSSRLSMEKSRKVLPFISRKRTEVP